MKMLNNNCVSNVTVKYHNKKIVYEKNLRCESLQSEFVLLRIRLIMGSGQTVCTITVGI